MATKRIKNGAWEFKVTRSKLLPNPIYLRFADEAEGDAYVRRLEALLDRGIVPSELLQDRPGANALRQAVHRYTSEVSVARDDRRNLRVLLERLPAAITLRELTFAWASSLVSKMKREDQHSPGTIRHHVGALSRCLDWLAAHGELAANPLRLLPRGYAVYTDEDAAAAGGAKVDAERERRLLPGEEDKIRGIMAGAKPDGKQRPLELREQSALVLLFDLALETAMRMRELYTLGWDQVDIKHRTVSLDKTKNGDRRQVPLSSVALARIQEFRPTVGERAGQVFPWWSGSLADAELRRCTSLLSRQFGRIFDAAGSGDLHFHDLRHEAISRMFEKTTLSDVEIAKIVGHRTTRMLMRYANLRASSFADRMW